MLHNETITGPRQVRCALRTAIPLSIALVMTVTGPLLAQPNSPPPAAEPSTAGPSEGATAPSEPANSTATTPMPDLHLQVESDRAASPPPPEAEGAPQAEEPVDPIAGQELRVVPPVKLDLSDDGSRYLRVVTWVQLWMRSAQLNPGTQLAGNEKGAVTDVAIRRARMLLFGKLTPEVLLLMHIGINNQSFAGDRKPQVFVHDVWGQVDVFENYLTLGVGLHYWGGISRMTNSSTFRYLALDAPGVNWPTIEATDQFGRQLGIFAKGQVGPLDYRVALNKPFVYLPELTPGGPVNFHSDGTKPVFAGYVQWMFLESESNLLPFTVGSYQGEKSVFNLGIGAHYQPKATANLTAGGDLAEHDMLLLGLDAFFDHPVAGGALTAYAAYYYYDFGPDFVRNVGFLSVGEGGTSLNGAGTRYPMMGTGHHLYTQAGFVLPFQLGYTRLQPFAALQVSAMDGLDDPAVIPDLGLNWLLAGHGAKFTVQYRSRPVFIVASNGNTVDSRASEVVGQLQLVL